MMICNRCGCDPKPQLAVHETKSAATGPPHTFGQRTETALIVLCPACASCQRGSVGFVFRVILATIAAVVLFRLVWLWIN